MLPSAGQHGRVVGSTTGNGLGVDAFSFQPRTGIIVIVVITLGAFSRSSSLICKGKGRLLDEVMLLLNLIPKDTRVEGGIEVDGKGLHSIE